MTILLWSLFGLSAIYSLLFVATCIVGARADKQWLAELEGQWPIMPDLDGQDMFAQYPIAGLPENESGNQ